MEESPSNNTIARIPADRIIDVLSYWSLHDPGYPRCARSVHPDFDRQAVRKRPSNTWDATKRQLLVTTPEGRHVLQRTLTSSRDWIVGPPTPHAVP